MWNRNAAYQQILKLYKQEEKEQVPHIPDAKLADEICRMSTLYKMGIISSKNFLCIVHDIAGGGV